MWDNYDRFVETSSGKNTLHDTVGIIYQNVPTLEQLNIIERNDVMSAEIGNLSINIRDLHERRKRSFEPEVDKNLLNAKQRRPEFWHSSVQPAEAPQSLINFKQINFA